MLGQLCRIELSSDCSKLSSTIMSFWFIILLFSVIKFFSGSLYCFRNSGILSYGRSIDSEPRRIDRYDESLIFSALDFGIFFFESLIYGNSKSIFSSLIKSETSFSPNSPYPWSSKTESYVLNSSVIAIPYDDIVLF